MIPGIKITMTQVRADEILQALARGTPITPTESTGWSGDDMLALAGFCLFGAMSQGPEAWVTTESDFAANLVGAMLAYREMAEKVADGEFRIEFGDYMLGYVSLEGEAPRIKVQVAAKGVTT